MLKIIDEFFGAFRAAFSREKGFQWFVLSVMAMAMRFELDGVSSIMRTLHLPDHACDGFYHFFRSKSWSLKKLESLWIQKAARVKPLKIAGRTILAADGYKHYKEGRKIPGVKPIRDSSQSQSKKNKINGHLFGAVARIVQGTFNSYGLVLSMKIHDGNEQIEQWKENQRNSHCFQMYLDCAHACRLLKESCFAVFDRYFLNVETLKQWMRDFEEGLDLHLVFRCKSNLIAYDFPRISRGRGRPRKRGYRVSMKQLMKDDSIFEEVEMKLYGSMQKVRYCHFRLLWGAGLNLPLLFVLAKTEHGSVILASTDLEADPLDIIQVFSCRMKIEQSFKDLNEKTGVWTYRFHSHSTPKYVRNTKLLKELYEAISDPKDREKILDCFEAINRYVFLNVLALGLLRILCLEYETKPEGILFPFTRKKKKDRTVTLQVMKHHLLEKMPVWLFTHRNSNFIKYLIEAKKESYYPAKPGSKNSQQTLF